MNKQQQIFFFPFNIQVSMQNKQFLLSNIIKKQSAPLNLSNICTHHTIYYSHHCSKNNRHSFHLQIQQHKINNITITSKLPMSQQLAKQITLLFEPIQLIGSGAYGHVWKVINRKTKKTCALKKSFDAFQNRTDAQRTYRQIMFLKQLKHSHIIKLLDIIKAENQKDIYLAFELMDIDLYTLIRQNLLSDRHRRYIAYQSALAIQYMHVLGLVHRDIKPSNVLVNEDCFAKICDFGLVRAVDQDQFQNDSSAILTQYIATRWYRAPQILLGSKQYTKSIDVWSFGCMLGQMLRGKPMFPGNSTLNQLQRVLSWTGPPTLNDLNSLKTKFGRQMLELLNKIKQIPIKQFINAKSYCEDGIDLIKKTLQFNPNKRPSMQEVLRHPYFKEFFKQEHIYKAEDYADIKQPGHSINVWDQHKLSVKQYRSMIYELSTPIQASKPQIQSHIQTKKHSISKTQQQKNCTPSPVISMQASETQKKNYSQVYYQQNKLHGSLAQNKSSTEHEQNRKTKHGASNLYVSNDKKPRTASGKKKYSNICKKSPDLSRKKHLATQGKQYDILVQQRKNSLNSNVRLFCQSVGHTASYQKHGNSRKISQIYGTNSGTGSGNGSTKVTQVSFQHNNGRQSVSKEKDKKNAEGLARFFYRRGRVF